MHCRQCYLFDFDLKINSGQVCFKLNPSLNRTHDLSFFSGGIFCDSAGVTCGGTAIGVSGVIYREGHTFVLNHGVTADNAAGSLGFKLSYIQLPCSASGTSYTTV